MVLSTGLLDAAINLRYQETAAHPQQSSRTCLQKQDTASRDDRGSVRGARLTQSLHAPFANQDVQIQESMLLIFFRRPQCSVRVRCRPDSTGVRFLTLPRDTDIDSSHADSQVKMTAHHLSPKERHLRIPLSRGNGWVAKGKSKGW